jgi:murein DD-endopeptidase MepM/ murein hydrolase activator NlpD
MRVKANRNARRRFLAGAVMCLCSISRPGSAAPRSRATVSANPGTLVRWSVPGTKRCGMSGRSWAALQETCYYPIDLLQKPAVIEVVRFGASGRERARISVESYTYGSEDLDLGDIPQANPSPEDLKRNAREQARVARIWRRKEGPARFTLPLGPPANPLPQPKTFGWNRSFNGKPAAQPHMGADYALPAGTPLAAVADGTVVLAEDLFYPGNAIFIDHGNGLVTMYFHLSEMSVASGQAVKKGEKIGLVGSTGRATGPHLFLGARWHKARIDPQLLLEDPAKIPAIESGQK